MLTQQEKDLSRSNDCVSCFFFLFSWDLGSFFFPLKVARAGSCVSSQKMRHHRDLRKVNQHGAIFGESGLESSVSQSVKDRIQKKVHLGAIST